MLRRLTLGFAGVITAAIAIAACSSSDATQSISVGPTFTTQTLYAADVSQNAVNIYTPSPKSTNGPLYQIGGGNTTLAGPQYIAFDPSSNLWVTNYLASTTEGLLLEFKAQATGNVLPFQTYSLGNIRPRGIASTAYTFANDATATNILAVGIVDPSQSANYTSGIEFYESAAISTPYQVIAGPATGLNVPSGVAFDSKANLYVTNLQAPSVEVFALPTLSPSPSPSASASPTTTPSPTPTPVGSTPTPSASATPYDLAPIATISGTITELGQPTGIALDTAGNIYVSDQASGACGATKKCPAVLIFPAGSSGGVAPAAIAGSNTLLAAPTDVKVDKNGDIYVADTAGGTGVVYEYAATTKGGNVAPIATLKSPGSIIGLALTP